MQAMVAGLLLAMSLCAVAQNEYGSATVSDVLAVYDSDAFTANVDEWPPVIGERIK
ncbi:hypothetical protein GCM10007159_03290 [Modicisalibacter luteus]|nr:hypothetical protein GCM10007159_03290 [Halomonas lutea]